MLKGSRHFRGTRHLSLHGQKDAMQEAAMKQLAILSSVFVLDISGILLSLLLRFFLCLGE
jgi:hypothetical protein